MEKQIKVRKQTIQRWEIPVTARKKIIKIIEDCQESVESKDVESLMRATKNLSKEIKKNSKLRTMGHGDCENYCYRVCNTDTLGHIVCYFSCINNCNHSLSMLRQYRN